MTALYKSHFLHIAPQFMFKTMYWCVLCNAKVTTSSGNLVHKSIILFEKIILAKNQFVCSFIYSFNISYTVTFSSLSLKHVDIIPPFLSSCINSHLELAKSPKQLELTWIFSKMYVCHWLVSFERKQYIVNSAALITIKYLPEIINMSILRKTSDKNPICFRHSLQHFSA